jgi:uncharacterized protein YigE (DUF2233 family)
MRLSSGALTLRKMCLGLFAEGGKQKLDINNANNGLKGAFQILKTGIST